MRSNWGLTGHEWAVNLLRRHVARGEARHAYLFTGPDGVGRRTLALRFAQALNCTNPPAPGEFCGECRECRQIAAMKHSDLVVTKPVIRDGSLKVDQIRKAQSLIYLKPYQARYRVSLFLEFETATMQAQNALLKTLEEAPAHAVMILTAREPEQLLPTIVSRCEVIRLRPLAAKTVEQILLEDGTDPKKVTFFAQISEGRPGFAKGLLVDGQLLKDRIQQLEDLNALLRSTRVQKFAYADVITKARCSDAHVEENIVLEKIEEQELGRIRGRCVIRRTFAAWLSFWRDVLIRTSGASVPITNLDFEEQINALASRMDLPAARRVVADMELGIKRLERNVNTRLLTEVLLLDWPKL